MTASNETVVASAILKDTKRALDILDRVQKVQPSSTGSRVLYATMRSCGTNGVIPEPAVVERLLRDRMEGLSQSKRQEGLKSLTQAVSLSMPSRDEIELAIRKLLDAEKKKVILTAANQIYDAIERDEVSQAEVTLAKSIAEISLFDYDNAASAQDAQDYDFYKDRSYEGPRIGFGLRRLDECLMGGGQKKDFYLLAGYAKEGKTTMVLNMAYRACLKGRNVAFVSLEMPLDQVMCAVYTLHSRKFVRNGLTYFDVLSRGSNLSESKYDALQKTIEDFQTNTKYGTFHVIVPKEDATIITVHQQILQLRRRLPTLDLTIVDYLQNLDPVNTRDQTRIQVAHTMRAARNIAMRFNNGEGTLFVSPHPVKQESYNIAVKEDYYPPTCLRETAEAGAKATAVVWILCPPKLREQSKARVGIALQRNGDTGPQKGWTITAQLARKYIADMNDEPPSASLRMGT